MSLALAPTMSLTLAPTLARFAAWQREHAHLDARTLAWGSWTGLGISGLDTSLGMADWLAPIGREQART